MHKIYKKKKINKKKLKAIVPVHLTGLAQDSEIISKFAKNRIKIIEDAAHFLVESMNVVQLLVAVSILI